MAVSRILQRDKLKVMDDPSVNTCRSNILGLNKSSFSRIASKELGFYSYKPSTHQMLKATDLARRREFCNYASQLNNQQIDMHVFSDEKIFTLNGAFNRQNTR
ncbi:uncharacterized protein LOC111716318 [Eurytemora carolleeae]|uniref:uncharacterized protein LOC111716318 n=1 Tax=Eurytemora carolleeae TaxID=1294199 RepID=UPI000C7955B0|nr:uncharacterized protein LOC111716318 [Eurytemora carolleeae]|eukprot:XP_023347525.1 uncharacterized protein LOC111716318 [Eurytemora affinis]